MSEPSAGARPTVRERGWTLRARLGRAFAAVTAIFLILAAAVTVSATLFTRAGNQVVYRWQPAISTSGRLLVDLVSQETGIRGYALTRDRKFLQPYEQFGSAQRRDEQRLSDLVGDDDELDDMIGVLVAATHRWRDRIAEPAVAAIGRGDPAGARLVESALARQRFDQIRTAARNLTAELQRQTRSARTRRSVEGVILAGAGVLSILIVAASGFILRRGLHRSVLGPVERLGEQTRHVAEGDMHRQIVADGPAELTMLGHDVEAMRRQIASELAHAKETQDELRWRGEELARSNEDLQQFAYVASHDLSEPLRKVANFCQLLERQYGPQLDDRARQYIDFAVDGAKRMQLLITDLLSLSRVGRTTETFVPVDLDIALDQAIANLSDRLTSAGGQVERTTPLPVVRGDQSLVTSLLENLVGNAVKYRRHDVAPVVEISAQYDPDAAEWTVTVSDNGIGIDPEYADRIFVVFQRLHLRDEYGGTGIGLALCRKIVEFHGGRIWLATVESGAAGTTFRFTLPEGVQRAESRD